jgi:hypothetical protein
MCPRRRWRGDRRKLRYGFAAGRRGRPTCGTPPGATPFISKGDLGGCGPIGMRIHTGSAAQVTRSRPPERLDRCDAILEGLAPPFAPVAAARRPHIHEEHAMVPRDTSPGMGTWPPPMRPTSEMVWCGARHSRVVTRAVRSPVRPATRWRRVVSMASARVSAGKMVVSRRASIDLPAPGGPSSRTFGSERLYPLHSCRGMPGEVMSFAVAVASLGGCFAGLMR